MKRKRLARGKNLASDRRQALLDGEYVDDGELTAHVFAKMTRRQFDFICALAGEDGTLSSAVRLCIDEAMKNYLR